MVSLIMMPVSPSAQELVCTNHHHSQGQAKSEAAEEEVLGALQTGAEAWVVSPCLVSKRTKIYHYQSGNFREKLIKVTLRKSHKISAVDNSLSLSKGKSSVWKIALRMHFLATKFLAVSCMWIKIAQSTRVNW